MKDYSRKIMEAAEDLKARIDTKPRLALVLGSGLGAIGDLIEDPQFIDYGDVKHFPVSTVEGHAGRFVVGRLSGVDVIAMQGRFHYYEGYDMKAVTFPIRVMKLLGVESVLLTNAAGGVNLSFSPGDLMVITDHINNSGANPLIGANLDDFGPRFPDMSLVYDRETNIKVMEKASSIGIDLRTGVYQFNSGPAYETPAEIVFARSIGSDAVGMSTVPEAIVAVHSGMKVTGISCITNMAAGVLDQPLDHREVVETAERVKETFMKLVLAIVPIL